MARWIIGGIGVLLLVVLFILWNRPDRQVQSSVDRATATTDIPSETTGRTRTPKIADRPVAPVVSTQTAPDQTMANESETDQMKKMVEMSRPKQGGPLKILKRVYEDESRDATANETEKLIRDEFGTEHLPDEFLHNVMCHKSVCKVEMYWTEKNPLVLMALAMRIGPTLTGYLAFDPEPEPDKEGRTLVTVYILRKGDLSNL